jgi:hypothetical protein
MTGLSDKGLALLSVEENSACTHSRISNHVPKPDRATAKVAKIGILSADTSAATDTRCETYQPPMNADERGSKPLCAFVP